MLDLLRMPGNWGGSESNAMIELSRSQKSWNMTIIQPQNLHKRDNQHRPRHTFQLFGFYCNSFQSGFLVSSKFLIQSLNSLSAATKDPKAPNHNALNRKEPKQFAIRSAIHIQKARTPAPKRYEEFRTLMEPKLKNWLENDQAPAAGARSDRKTSPNSQPSSGRQNVGYVRNICGSFTIYSRMAVPLGRESVAMVELFQNWERTLLTRRPSSPGAPKSPGHLHKVAKNSHGEVDVNIPIGFSHPAVDRISSLKKP